MSPKCRVFLDTSVVLAGLNSPSGASGFIITLFKLDRISVVISPEVITEIEEVLPHKFPLLKPNYFDFLLYQPHTTKKLTVEELQKAYSLVNTSDAPILAGALKSKANYLVTLDKSFKKLAHATLAGQKLKIRLLFPGEFINLYRREYRLD